MKIGAEDRNKAIAAIALMVVAALSVVYALWGSQNPSAATSPPAANPAPRRAPAKGKAAPPAENLDPTLRLAMLHASEGVKYEGTGRNIFRAQAEEPIPHPVKNPLIDKKAQQQGPPQPVGPPPPPPINLKFYGFANKPGETTKKVFLSEGDNIFIASEGDVVNRRYKVVKIGQASVEIEDLLNNNKQTIPLSTQS